MFFSAVMMVQVSPCKVYQVRISVPMPEHRGQMAMGGWRGMEVSLRALVLHLDGAALGERAAALGESPSPMPLSFYEASLSPK